MERRTRRKEGPVAPNGATFLVFQREGTVRRSPRLPDLTVSPNASGKAIAGKG